MWPFRSTWPFRSPTQAAGAVLMIIAIGLGYVTWTLRPAPEIIADLDVRAEMARRTSAEWLLVASPASTQPSVAAAPSPSKSTPPSHPSFSSRPSPPPLVASADPFPTTPRPPAIPPVFQVDVAPQIRDAAKPAKVDFYIASKMLMGEVYEARLELLRPETKPIFGGSAAPALSQEVQILDRVSALLHASRLNIHLLSEQWQEVPLGARGLWMWRVEPMQPGTASLVVAVRHAGRFQGQDRVWTVEHFPRTVTVEVTALHQVKTAVLDVFNALNSVFGAAAAFGSIASGLTGIALYRRGRRIGPTGAPLP